MTQNMTEQELDNAMNAYVETEIAWHNEIRKKAIKCLFSKKSFASDFFCWRWYEIAFYWLKTFICLVFKWTNGNYLNAEEVVFFNVRPTGGEYDGDDWDTCWVEYGFFKNWNVCIFNDSSC